MITNVPGAVAVSWTAASVLTVVRATEEGWICRLNEEDESVTTSGFAGFAEKLKSKLTFTFSVEISDILKIPF